ncbi:DUF255 domain-containing protein [Brevibacterium sp. BRM-1]|nr:DUF255 domain-containing protein [Brevibacterium sp. BRM-1]WAL39360.1 DUF255 domain-containing protein [Brevibacterium sp. BRM-1]
MSDAPRPQPEPVDNRLAGSTSPYLRLHEDDPVDWRPWGEDAFAEARERDVPVLVSIGYSTCHWCHVMARETFCDPAIGALLRAHVVAVKVDREELPQVDAAYMGALQALRGQGGWPLTAFATPDGAPFFAGTYYPPRPAHGAPSFAQVVQAVAHMYRDRRAEVDRVAGQLDARLTGLAERISMALPAGEDLAAPSAEELDAAYEQLVGDADFTWGGFGTAPKFPPLPVLMALIRSLARAGRGPEGSGGLPADSAALACAGADADVGAACPGLPALGEVPELDRLRIVRRTLLGIAAGGMRDQLRGGICRYSVDARWQVPHFEKMLGDNALHLRTAVAWHRLEAAWDPDSRWTRLAAREAADTARFLLTDLALPGGGFAAALDADAPTASPPDARGAGSSLGASALREGAHAVFAPADGGPPADWDDSPYALADAPELGGGVLVAPGIRAWLDGDDGAAGAGSAAGADAATAPAPWETPGARSVSGRLAAQQDARPRPARDDKLIVEHAGLAATALCEAAAVFDRADWAAAAVATLTALRALEAAGLPRSATDGRPGPAPAGLADWCALLRAELAAAQLPAELLPERLPPAEPPPGTDGAGAWAGIAARAATVRAAFADEEATGLRVWDAPADPLLPARSADPIDGAGPAARSALAELALLLGEGDCEPAAWTDFAHRLLGGGRPLMHAAPNGAGWLCWVAECALAPVRVATADPALARAAAADPRVLAVVTAGGQVPAAGAVVCRGTACSLPLADAAGLRAELGA